MLNGKNMDLNEIIHCEKYYELCDYHYEDEVREWEHLPSGVVRVDTASIPEFFDKVNGNGEKYVVISPRCDYGIHQQNVNLPCFDFYKWIKLAMRPEHGYNDLHMPARLNKKKCNIRDTYSIKCWSYTEATFSNIPLNVLHWFVVNCEITHPKVTTIPFGINGVDGDLSNAEAIANYKFTKSRDKLLYVNFQFYTTDRAELWHYYKNINHPQVTCKRDVGFDEYLDDLATHRFILCPAGNGIDCYRTLESIYMGAVPIIEHRLGMSPYIEAGSHVVTADNLFSINLDKLIELIVQRQINMDTDKYTWSYWKNIIERKINGLRL